MNEPKTNHLKPLKRTRTSHACTSCWSRKVKCDKKEPCGRCLKTNNGNCVYPRQGALGRPPKNAVFHGKGRNHSGRKLIIREFIFENVGNIQNKNTSIHSSNSTGSSSMSGTPSRLAITSGFYVNSEWWILSKDAIQDHHYLNTYFQTIYSFYVLRGLSIRERFSNVSYRLPEKPRLKFNTLQSLFTWWISLSVNMLIKRASQVQLETYSVPSLTLYVFKMNDDSNSSPTTTTATDGRNQQTTNTPRTTSSTSMSPTSFLSADSSPSLSSISSLSPVPIFPRMQHHDNSSDPLRSLPSEQAINLINDFFLVHPHSILINKAKLMKDYWADTANPLLLSVIYGTTQCFSQLLQGIPVCLWESGTENNRNPFLTHAHSLLETLPTSPSTSDYQATVILALFEVAFGYAKLGSVLIATTYLMGTQLGLWDQTFKAADAAEEELVNMSFWAVFRATTHGCIEMGTSIVDTLVYHQRSFPPANIYESASHRYNMLNNIKTNDRQAYLVESFYSGAVVTYYSGILFACLPKPYVNVYGIKTEDSTFEGSEFLTMLRSIKDVETRVHMVLDDFNQFIQQQRHKWTTIQLYTIETSYRLYRIHFRFLQPTHTCGTRKYQEDLIPAAATGDGNCNSDYISFVIDPADPAISMRLHQVLDDVLAIVDELEAILTPTNTTTTTGSKQTVTLLPHDLMVTVYETSIQLLLLNYQLDPTQRIYDAMTKLLALAKPLDTHQSPSAAMKNVRQRLKMFMKHHHHHTPNTATPAMPTKKDGNQLALSQGDHINSANVYNDPNVFDLNFDAQPFFLLPPLQQQQQTHQYQMLVDPSWPISSYSPSHIPYYSQHLLDSSSPIVPPPLPSHLVQYVDTHQMTQTSEQAQEDNNGNDHGNIDIGGYHPAMIWDDYSSLIGWDNILHPYDASLSLLEQDHQDLGQIPFLNM